MLRLRAWALGFLLVLAATAAGTGTARAVAVSVGTGNGLAGQTVNIDINTADVTGQGILSLQFDLSYNSSQVTAVDVINTGTLAGTAGWQTPQFFVSSVSNTGKVTVSDAGTTPLTGAGSMVRVSFLLNPALLNGGSTSLTLSNFKFNEGSPTVTTTTGSITINVTPQIDVYPDLGEVIRGQTLQFNVSGSVTNPVTWSTSNPAIATISSSGLLTGVAPGAVTVTATDAALHASTTTGTVLIRGMGITSTTVNVLVGQPLAIPITVTSLTGLGIRSGQFSLTWGTNVASFVSVTAPPGTLLNGWGPIFAAATSNGCSVDFTGSTDLSGSGILCYLNLQASPTSAGSSSLTFVNPVFNETMPAKATNGFFSVGALPTIFASPDNVTLLAGQTQQYTVSGATAPLTWSVEDPTLATISPTGLLTAVKGGVTRVRVQDANGSVDYTNNLTIYDLKVTLGSVNAPPGSTVILPITSDRTVGSLNIYSMQFAIDWTGANITNGVASPSGLWSSWGLGNIQSHFDNGLTELDCAAGGVATLPNTSTLLGSVNLVISPSAPSGTNITVSLARLVFNEGSPIPQIVNGTVHVLSSADAPPVGTTAEFALRTSEPNPARGDGIRIPFSIGTQGGRVQLAIFGLDGRRIRTLADGPFAPGPHESTWNGRDDTGHLVPAGLYFTRLEHQGRIATQKLTYMP